MDILAQSKRETKSNLMYPKRAWQPNVSPSLFTLSCSGRHQEEIPEAHYFITRCKFTMWGMCGSSHTHTHTHMHTSWLITINVTSPTSELQKYKLVCICLYISGLTLLLKVPKYKVSGISETVGVNKYIVNHHLVFRWQDLQKTLPLMFFALGKYS